MGVWSAPDEGVNTTAKRYVETQWRLVTVCESVRVRGCEGEELTLLGNSTEGVWRWVSLFHCRQLKRTLTPMPQRERECVYLGTVLYNRAISETKCQLLALWTPTH